MLKEQLTKNDIPIDDVNILTELFDTYDECQPYIESEMFDSLKLEVFHLLRIYIFTGIISLLM